MEKKSILFYVLLCIFIATALITLGGIVGKIKVKENHLDQLFNLLIIEVAATMIKFATSKDDKDNKDLLEGIKNISRNNEKITLRIEQPKSEINKSYLESFPRYNQPYKGMITIQDTNSGNVKTEEVKFKRMNGVLETFPKEIPRDSLIKVIITNSEKNEQWKSDFFDPRTCIFNVEKEV